MNVFDRLYDYQKEAVIATQKSNKGIICMPTGVGKTFCQASIIADDIVKNPNQFRMYVVNAPRIMLSYQLLREVYGFLVGYNIEARYMFVHSGGTSDEKELEEIRKGTDVPYSQISSGTSPKAIGEMIATAEKQNLPLIFFSTYNSAERIQKAIESIEIFEERNLVDISIVMNDEAHYLIQEQFHGIVNNGDNKPLLPSLRCYFFTATMMQTPSDNGLGMNNKEVYGEVIYQMLPIDAMRIGKMVRPRLHYVTTDGVYNVDDYNKSLNKIIVDTFRQHEKVLIKMKPKVLVSAKGTQDIASFLNSDEYEELRQEGVDIYAVASTDEIGNRINDERVRRQEFLKRLKKDGTNKSKRLIVLHYDILAEGIDVSGFTGIMPLRTLTKSKFLQTFGRSARPDKEDRPIIDAIVNKNGFISNEDWKQMNKPFAYVMIPNIIHNNADDEANTTYLIKELRTYGFKPSEDIIYTSPGRKSSEVDEPDGVNITNKRPPNLGEIIENIEMQLEAEEDAKLDKDELLKKVLNEL